MSIQFISRRIGARSFRKLSMIFAAGVLGLLPAATLAHGPQIQVTNEGGKITTRQIFLDSVPELYNNFPTPPTAVTSVYVIPILPSGTQWHTRPNTQLNVGTGLPDFNSGPGVAYGYGWTYTNPTTYTTTFPVGSIFSVAFKSGLQRWDGSAWVDPGTEQLQIFRGSASAPTATATSNDAATPSAIALTAVAAPTAANPDPHGSLSYRLLGDGTSATSGGQDGIYRIQMQITNSDAGVTASDPYWFVLHKGTDFSTVQSLVGSQFASQAGLGQVQFVPEPGSVGGLVFAAAGLLIRRRKNAAR